MTTMGYFAETHEARWQEQRLEQMLQLTRRYAWGWLTRWNSAAVYPLNRQDLEDILSEVEIATLRFKVPEGATDWEPPLKAYIKRAAHRLYCRFRQRQPQEVFLEDLPPDHHPLVFMDDGSDSGDMACLQAVAHQLRCMPRHHALAFLLHLESDLATSVLEAGGTTLYRHLQGEAMPPLRQLVLRTPMRDREIASLLGITPRAVIRARQHARERLRAYLQNMVNLRG
jgi:hypothetical protein